VTAELSLVSPLDPVANAILMFVCAPFVLLALFAAAIGVFRARGRRFASRLVISVGFLLVAGSCMLHMVVPPHGAVCDFPLFSP
jgi:TRAP-type uncharacterized transport system fused permease subunit